MDTNRISTQRRKGARLITTAVLFSLFSLVCGCTTKTRSIDLDGMYVSEAGTLAVGSIEVMAAPVGEETVAIRYAEDTAWLSPSTKTHEIKILLTGTNSITAADGIVSNICSAFVSTAPVLNGGAGRCAVCACSTNATDNVFTP